MDTLLKLSLREAYSRRPLAISLGLAILGASPLAYSASIQVTTADDPVGSISSCTLRQAITAMNAASLGASSSCTNSGAAFGTSDTITFASAVTTVALSDSPGNELLITDSALSITGSGLGGITISRVSGATNSFRIFHDRGSQLYLTGLTITNGQTTAANAKGGAIFLDNGFGGVTLKNCIVNDNTTTGAGASGGAIAAGNSFNTDTVKLVGSVVSGNSTQGDNARGGAIYATHQVYMENSTVTGNYTSGKTSPGGAIWTISNILYSSTISDNKTTGDYSPGGAIFGYPSLGSIEGHNSTLSGNTTQGYESPGGAADVTYAQTLSYFLISNNSTVGNQSSGGALYTKNFFIANSVISGNSTAGVESSGGAIHAHSTTAVDSTIQTSTVSNNQATGSGASGGGLWSLTARMIESTVSGNSAAQGGGGWHVDVCSSGTPILAAYNSTVAFNATSAAGGAAIYLGSAGCSAFTGGSTQTTTTAKITSSILADTTVTGSNAADVAVGAGLSLTLDTDHDLIQRPSSNPSITIVNATSSPALLSTDPKIAPLANSGCGTKSGDEATAVCVPTHAITCGPAYKGGSNPNNYTDDERGTGFPREHASDFTTDIGAFELEPGGDEIFCDGFDGIP